MELWQLPAYKGACRHESIHNQRIKLYFGIHLFHLGSNEEEVITIAILLGFCGG
jgi:hypothetical protein